MSTLLKCLCHGRHFSTTSVVSKSKPEWLAMKQAYLAEREADWKYKSKANHFRTNVGIARQMKGLELDPEDPAVTSADPDPNANPGEVLESIRNDTKRWDKYVHRRPTDYMTREQLALVLTKKKYFSPPKDPNLLTYMEQQMIRQLHKSDPATWTVEKLSEGFPATPAMIKPILRGRGRFSLDQIQENDQKVKKNWKLLSQGRLETSEELKKHLKSIGNDPKKRLDTILPAQEKYKLKYAILEEVKKSSEMPKIAVGKVGRIVADYNAKVNQKEKALKGVEDKSADTVVVESEKVMFSPDTEVDHDFVGPSPYRDTALLSSHDRYRQEKNMTMNEFKNTHLSHNFSRTWSKETMKTRNRMKYTFHQWMEQEMAKQAMVTKPKVLNVDEVLEEMSQSKSTTVRKRKRQNKSTINVNS